MNRIENFQSNSKLYRKVHNCKIRKTTMYYKLSCLYGINPTQVKNSDNTYRDGTYKCISDILVQEEREADCGSST